MVRPVLDAVTQHVDGAALADLALQAGQELAPCRAVLAEVERLGRLGLRLPQESGELRQVHAVLAVVVVGIAADPANSVGGRPLAHLVGLRRVARVAGQRRADQPFEAALAGVGVHALVLLGDGVEVVGRVFVGVAQGLRLVERLRLLDFVRQPRRHLAHVQLAGDHVGDQAGAVFAEEGDFVFCTRHSRKQFPSRISHLINDLPLFPSRWNDEIK